MANSEHFSKQISFGRSIVGEPERLVCHAAAQGEAGEEPLVHMTEVKLDNDDCAKDSPQNEGGLDLLGLEFSEIDHNDAQSFVCNNKQSAAGSGAGVVSGAVVDDGFNLAEQLLVNHDDVHHHDSQAHH